MYSRSLPNTILKRDETKGIFFFFGNPFTYFENARTAENLSADASRRRRKGINNKTRRREHGRRRRTQHEFVIIVSRPMQTHVHRRIWVAVIIIIINASSSSRGGGGGERIRYVHRRVLAHKHTHTQYGRIVVVPISPRRCHHHHSRYTHNYILYTHKHLGKYQNWRTNNNNNIYNRKKYFFF